jgi:O-antigen ligase/tetratricopeptide (TPR) repeat protein
MLLFWITQDTVRTLESVRRLFGIFLMTGTGVALMGLLHYAFWNGKFYGLWQVWWTGTERHLRAPFTNRNHFAGFLALTVAPAITWQSWLLWRRKPQSASSAPEPTVSRYRTRKPAKPSDLTILLTSVALILILACVALSQSRGGAVAALVALLCMGCGLFGINSRRSSLTALIALACAVLMALALGRENPLRRTLDLFSGEQPLDELTNRRLWLWQADVHAVPDFPLFGSGVGTHQYVYPLYLEKAHHTVFTHAENCYVQILMECGLVGALLLGLVVICAGRWCWQGWRLGAREDRAGGGIAALAVAISLLVALLHACVDFVWYVPAYAAALAVLIGLACSISRSHRVPNPDTPNHGTTRSAVGWLRGSALLAAWLFLGAMIGAHFVINVRTELAWNSYYRLLSASDRKNYSPSDEDLLELSEPLAKVCSTGTEDPDHYYRLGLLELKRFALRTGHSPDSPSLIQVRQVLRAEGVSTPDETKVWLTHQFGSDLSLLEHAQEHFRQAARCCPLMGSAYMRLAELDFLDRPPGPGPGDYLHQALRVRPNDPDICLQAGIEIWMAGDLLGAQCCWKRACELERDTQWKLLPLLVESFPVEQAATLIALDFKGMQWLAREEAKRGQVAAQRCAATLAQKLVEENPSLATDAATWIALHELYREADLPQEAEHCLCTALEFAPENLGYHLQFARWLLEQDRRSEALDHAQRTRKRFPSHVEAERLVEEILRGGRRRSTERKGHQNQSS